MRNFTIYYAAVQTLSSIAAGWPAGLQNLLKD